VPKVAICIEQVIAHCLVLLAKSYCDAGESFNAQNVYATKRVGLETGLDIHIKDAHGRPTLSE